MVLKFLQFSDLHLGSKIGGGRLKIPADKIPLLESEFKTTVRIVCQIAFQEKVDCILIPGDLFDDEAVSPDSVQYVIEQFGGIPTIPVLIAPGNHDFYSGSSLYNSEILTLHGFSPWPDNVIIFDSTEFKTVTLPNRDNITVTARAFAQNVAIQERLLQQKIHKDPSKINLLLFHGSLDGYVQHILQEEEKITAPFSEAELVSQDFHYTAVGHYHSYYEIRSGQQIIGAYSGCPFGRNLREIGEKYVLIGEINDEEVVKLEKRKVAKRRIQKFDLDITGLKHTEAVKEMIEGEIDSRRKGTEDIVYVELHGFFPPGIPLKIEGDFLTNRYYHVCIDVSRVKPDYDIKTYTKEGVDSNLVETQFVRKLLQEIEQAKGQQKRILEQALYYGLDALKRGQVEPRYED